MGSRPDSEGDDSGSGEEMLASVLVLASPVLFIALVAFLARRYALAARAGSTAELQGIKGEGRRKGSKAKSSKKPGRAGAARLVTEDPDEAWSEEDEPSPKGRKPSAVGKASAIASAIISKADAHVAHL